MTSSPGLSWQLGGMTALPAAIVLSLAAAAALADAPRVISATATSAGDGWSIEVTLSHPDTGWDHFANGWEVLAPNGTRLGYRELTHPHVDEMPFTRALTIPAVPDGNDHVLIRPKCNLVGYAPEPTPVALTP